MKRHSFFAVLISALISITSCGVSNSAQSAADKARYKDAIVDRNFDLSITNIIPSGYPSKTSTGEYSMKVRGDIVDTRLPFIGNSSFPIMPGEDISIVFKEEKVQMRKDFSKASRGKYAYMFEGPSSSGSWVVTLTLSDTGSAYIDCSSPQRGHMSYMAEIIIPQ